MSDLLTIAQIAFTDYMKNFCNCNNRGNLTLLSLFVCVYVEWSSTTLEVYGYKRL